MGQQQIRPTEKKTLSGMSPSASWFCTHGFSCAIKHYCSISFGAMQFDHFTLYFTDETIIKP